MHKYQYTYGDRPLDGYAVQRAIGRGGFGEVYYALSDSGREVALKVLNTYEQVELRGVSQCMNLKSPHLVTIFDIKQNDAGRSFVIMEHVSGPSLRDLLDDAPQGLGLAKAAFFLREIAKGLAYLHDAGIVHRDLKPGNIFYDAGYVKIGDYGLSKAITPSQHEGQTITVGTVHYMAPEIGAGCYDRSIDIYALGVLLYEMLTGRPPYTGDSHGEILMKHVTAEADLTGIDESMAEVIRKALTKDPAERYHTVDEMVGDLFKAEDVKSSLAGFAPASLSMAADRSAGKVRQAKTAPPPIPPKSTSKAPSATPQTAATPAAEANAGIGVNTATFDPLLQRQRWVLAAVTWIVVAFGTSLCSDGPGGRGWTFMITAFLIAGAAAGLAIGWQGLRLRGQSEFSIRVLTGAIAGATACAMAAVTLLGRTSESMYSIMLAIFVAMCIPDWAARISPTRWQRVSLRLALQAGAAGWFCAEWLDAQVEIIVGTMAGLSLVIQALTPMTSQAERPAAKRVESGKSLADVVAAAAELKKAKKVKQKKDSNIPAILMFVFVLIGLKMGLGAVELIIGAILVPIIADPIFSRRRKSTDKSGDDLPRRPVNSGLSTVSIILMFVAGVGAFMATAQVSRMFTAGVFGPDGTNGFYAIGIRHNTWLALAAATAVTAGLGAVLSLGVARRRSGEYHVLRGIIGATSWTLAFATAGKMFAPVRWVHVTALWRDNLVGQGIELMLGDCATRYGMAGLIMLAAATTLLAWPAPVRPAMTTDTDTTEAAA